MYTSPRECAAKGSLAPKKLSSPGFPPGLPLLGTAFAGAGLNIRRARTVWSAAHPNPYSLLTFASERRFAADCPLQYPRRFYHPRGHYPRCCTGAFAASRGSLGFRVFPNSLSQSRPLSQKRRRLNLSKFLFIKSRLGTLLIGLQRLPQMIEQKDHWCS